jgi:hypothetical protein
MMKVLRILLRELYNQLSEGISLGEAIKNAGVKCKRVGDKPMDWEPPTIQKPQERKQE